MQFLSQIFTRYFFQQITMLIEKIVPELIIEQIEIAMKGLNPNPELGIVTGKYPKLTCY